MKFKTFKKKVIPMALAVLTVFSVSVFGAGAEVSKKYLKDMPYPDIESNLNEDAYDKYSFTEFSGSVRRYFFDNDVECENAMKLEWNAVDGNYIDYSHPIYKITYNLNKEFKNFHSEIFTECSYWSNKVDFEILGDGNRLIKRSITRESNIINMDLGTTNIENLVIVIESVNDNSGPHFLLMFNNAYLTKEGVPVEEPTEIPTSAAPTEAPTSIATEAPKEEITATPTEITTVATEISTDVVKPTDATKQMSTSVPTSATQSGTNVSGASGTNGSNTSGGSNITSSNAGSSGKVVNTGEEYLIFISLGTLAGVLVAGVFIGLFFVIKKKYITR